MKLVFELQNATNNYVELGPVTSADGFVVMQGSTVVWRSPHTAREARDQQALLPAQLIYFTATWNGRPNQHGVKHLQPGVYTVQASRGGYSASTTITMYG